MKDSDFWSPLALPIGALWSLIAATGGSFLFAGLFLIVGERLGAYSETNVFLLRNFTFVFVLPCIFTSVLAGEKIARQGGKAFDVAFGLFLLIFLVAYMLGLWPQNPVLLPDFTVRAFLWFGGSAALSVVTWHYCQYYHQLLAGAVDDAAAISRVYLCRIILLLLSSILVVAPLIQAIFSGGTFGISPSLLLAPLMMIVLSGVFIAFQFGEAKSTTQISMLILTWLPLGWAFLLMPAVFMGEVFVANTWGGLFLVEPGSLYSAFTAFILLNLLLGSGFLLGKLAFKLKLALKKD